MSNGPGIIRDYATATALNIGLGLIVPGDFANYVNMLWCLYTAGFALVASYKYGILWGALAPFCMLGVTWYLLPTPLLSLAVVAASCACFLSALARMIKGRARHKTAVRARRSPAQAAKELVAVAVPVKTSDIDAIQILERFGYRVED